MKYLLLLLVVLAMFMKLTIKRKEDFLDTRDTLILLNAIKPAKWDKIRKKDLLNFVKVVYKEDIEMLGKNFNSLQEFTDHLKNKYTSPPEIGVPPLMPMPPPDPYFTSGDYSYMKTHSILKTIQDNIQGWYRYNYDIDKLFKHESSNERDNMSKRFIDRLKTYVTVPSDEKELWAWIKTRAKELDDPNNTYSESAAIIWILAQYDKLKRSKPDNAPLIKPPDRKLFTY